MLRFDPSKRSTHGNAYFSGFGKSRQIVFFETLLARLGHDEIVAVLAHELGHFKHRHIIKRIVLMAAMSLAGLWLLGWLMDKEWFYHGLGVTTPSTATALLLFLLAMAAFTFLLQPLMSFYSRKPEFEADATPQKMPAPTIWCERWSSSTTATPRPSPLIRCIRRSTTPIHQRRSALRS